MEALKKLTEEKMSMMHKNENERFFNKKWNWDSYRYQERFSLAINLVRKYISRKARIIDIGCAQGNFSTRLAAQGYKVLGLDIRPGLIKYSRWKARRTKVGSEDIDFVAGSALSLPITDNTYDCVLFLEIIEHLNKPEKALAELKRVLNKNGALIFSTVNSLRILGRKSFSQFKEIIQKKEIKGDTLSGKEHLFEFNTVECINLLACSGFKILEIIMFAPIFMYPIFMMNRIKSLPKTVLDSFIELFAKIERFCRGIMIVATKNG